jgi:hypothetical protein
MFKLGFDSAGGRYFWERGEHKIIKRKNGKQR